MNYLSQTRSGLTIFRLLVIAVIVGFLTLFLGETWCCSWGHKQLAMSAKCANNLKGICTTWMTNCQDIASVAVWTNAAKRKLLGNNQLSPQDLGNKRIRADQSAAMTAAIFEIWCANDPNNLPAALFRCPATSDEQDRPDSSLAASADRPDTNWGWSPKHSISYAFDYSAPWNENSPVFSDANRVIMSDRDPANHKNKKAIACFADSHTSSLRRQSATPSGSDWTKSTTGEHTQTRNGPLDAVVINDDAKDPANPSELPDNIFDNVGDLTGTMKPGDEFQIGTGSPRRAFVK